MGNNEARVELAAWLDRAGLSQRDLAIQLEISDGQVSSLISGRRTPSLALAARIEARTGIPAVSWVIEKDGVSA